MVRSKWVYRKLRNFRAGIEAGISCLKRAYGLGRCTWRGPDHFRPTSGPRSWLTTSPSSLASSQPDPNPALLLSPANAARGGVCLIDDTILSTISALDPVHARQRRLSGQHKILVNAEKYAHLWTETRLASFALGGHSAGPSGHGNGTPISKGACRAREMLSRTCMRWALRPEP